MLCDVCNTHIPDGEGEHITAESFSFLWTTASEYTKAISEC